MAAPSRSTKVGISGRTGTQSNTKDSYIQTFEIPITLIASAAAQDTGIKIPNNVQAISASINVDTPEATGTTKTVSVGYVGAAAAFLSTVDVSAAGNVGTTVLTARSPNGANLAYSLGSADFAELDAIAVITLIGWH